MTATELTAADVYAAYLEHDSSPAKTAEALGISVATIGRRVRAHRAAIEQDTAVEQPQTDTAAEVTSPETEDVPAAAPAGLDAADQAAYTIPCLQPDCDAQPGEACTSLNRNDERVTQPYAHPVRVDAAGARPAYSPPAAPETDEGFQQNLAAIATADPDLADELERADAGEHHEDAGQGDGHDHAAVPEGKVTKCDECGYDFGRPQRRRTCKVASACARRKAAGNPALGSRQAKSAAA
jgi:hypothetical protein